LVALEPQSLRSQTLCLLVKRVNLVIHSRRLGFGLIGAAQFFQRFLNGEFACFGHGKLSYQKGSQSGDGNNNGNVLAAAC
jgi:hypothetical protein